MNFKTNHEKLNKELQDIIRIFGSEFEETEISHTFKESETKLYNEINFAGEIHNFEYDFTKTDRLEDMRNFKRSSKTALFSVLSSKSNKEVVWGALTGIRPVKLYKNYIDKGLDAADVFKNQYFVHDHKIQLVKQIFDIQKPLYSKNDNDINLYVGIPFCASRCYYCSFISENINRVSPLVVDGYIDALCEDIKWARKTIKDGGYNLRSVYIGGGTPSSISEKQMAKMFEAIGEFKGEYTFEGGRADTLSEEKIALARKFANRISVNPQTASDETLKRIGRSHTYADFVRIFEIAKKHDFLINSDLICGLEGENFADFENTLEKITALDPQNITIHTLCLKSGSKYHEKDVLKHGNDVTKMVEYGYKKLAEAGYNPYYLYRQKYTLDNLENCGFAKKGFESIYNIDIMEENMPIISCGAGSVSKTYAKPEDRLERIPLPKDVRTYLEKSAGIAEKRHKLFLES
ncbi:MAG: coproporphyrinogen dehydrogenase HemZ [Bacillota bacterium]